MAGMKPQFFPCHLQGSEIALSFPGSGGARGEPGREGWDWFHPPLPSLHPGLCWGKASLEHNGCLGVHICRHTCTHMSCSGPLFLRKPKPLRSRSQAFLSQLPNAAGVCPEHPTAPKSHSRVWPQKGRCVILTLTWHWGLCPSPSALIDFSIAQGSHSSPRVAGEPALLPESGDKQVQAPSPIPLFLLLTSPHSSPKIRREPRHPSSQPPLL